MFTFVKNILQEYFKQKFVYTSRIMLRNIKNFTLD